MIRIPHSIPTLSRFIWIISFLLLGPAMGNLSAQSDEDCLMCHEDLELTAERNGRTISMYMDTARFSNSVHSNNTCISCHKDADDNDFAHMDGGGLNSVECGSCHNNQMVNNIRGIHGQALLKNDPNAIA